MNRQTGPTLRGARQTYQLLHPAGEMMAEDGTRSPKGQRTKGLSQRDLIKRRQQKRSRLQAGNLRGRKWIRSCRRKRHPPKRRSASRMKSRSSLMEPPIIMTSTDVLDRTKTND